MNNKSKVTITHSMHFHVPLKHGSFIAQEVCIH
jgi:hypothetical protein